MNSEHNNDPNKELGVAPEEKGRTDSVAIEGDRHHTHHDIPAHGHNLSTQKSVEENPDITLHYSHEHQHDHMHHGRTSLTARHDDILYAKGTTFDKSNVGDQDHSHHHHTKAGVSPTKISTNDVEDGQKHRFSRFYRKYKIFFHLFIWLVFTG